MVKLTVCIQSVRVGIVQRRARAESRRRRIPVPIVLRAGAVHARRMRLLVQHRGRLILRVAATRQRRQIVEENVAVYDIVGGRHRVREHVAGARAVRVDAVRLRAAGRLRVAIRGDGAEARGDGGARSGLKVLSEL